MLRIEFNDDQDRERKEKENTHLHLIEIQYFFEGNFLVFGTLEEKESYNTIYTDVPDKEFNNLKLNITDVAETTAVMLSDAEMTGETLSSALIEIENLKLEIKNLKGGN